MQRHRRWILAAAVVVGAGAVTAAVRAPTEPSAALVAAALVAGLALVAGAVIGMTLRWQTSRRFDIAESDFAFRTPRSAVPVFLAVFFLAGEAFFAEAGGWSWVHGNHDGGWVAILVMMGVPALLFTAIAWHGHGITLTPDGIRADRVAGTLTIPWTALSTYQPRPVTPPTEYSLDLVLARPDQVVKSGLVLRRNRISFEGTQPAFVAAAIRRYAAHPADRSMIGTSAGHQLIELPTLPTGPTGPPPSRRRITVLMILGVVVFAAGVAGDTWIGVTHSHHSFLSYVSDFSRQLSALLALSCFAAALNGLRARRRPTSQNTDPCPPDPTPPQSKQHLPPWARDVTDNS